MQYCGNTARVFVPGQGWSKPLPINEAAVLEREVLNRKAKGATISLVSAPRADRFGRDAGHDLVKE